MSRRCLRVAITTQSIQAKTTTESRAAVLDPDHKSYCSGWHAQSCQTEKSRFGPDHDQSGQPVHAGPATMARLIRIQNWGFLHRIGGLYQAIKSELRERSCEEAHVSR